MTTETIILDIESRNHLEKDCGGDVSKLKIGLAGIKFCSNDEFLFFDETNIDELEDILLEANEIIGFNLVGHNGLDYRMLENYDICTTLLIPKTFDLMTEMIRSFGSYKGMSLGNITENTFGIKKKYSKKANYKLIRSNHIEEVKDNLKHELRIIEALYLVVVNGGIVSFRTPLGLIDEHELSPLGGIYPEIGEEIIEPYDLPVGGMRLQIKEKFEDVVRCEKCRKYWKVKSVCYYGDTMPQKVYCQKCGNFLINVKANMFGEQTKINEVE